MTQALSAVKTNPLFGMWAKREDMHDVAAHVRRLRAPRLSADGNIHLAKPKPPVGVKKRSQT